MANKPKEKQSDVEKPTKTPVGYSFDCIINDIKTDAVGHTYITLKTHSEILGDVSDFLGEPLECAIKKFRDKRSNNANSYCWELCAQIASVMDLSSVDVYKDAIRERGMYKDITGTFDEIESLKNGWSNFGVGWFCEDVDNGPDLGTITTRFYYGSSTYDSLQMSRLINYLVQAANSLGLTTISERRRKELLEQWQKGLAK